MMGNAYVGIGRMAGIGSHVYVQVQKQLAEQFMVTIAVLRHAPRFSIEPTVICDCH